MFVLLVVPAPLIARPVEWSDPACLSRPVLVPWGWKSTARPLSLPIRWDLRARREPCDLRPKYSKMNVLRTSVQNLSSSLPTNGRPDAMTVRIVEIDESSDGQRLDNLLLRLCKGVPKSHVYRLIRSGQVRLNGRRCTADSRVTVGDRLRIPPVRTADGPDAASAQGDSEAGGGSRAPAVEFPILEETEELIAIDKPAGVAVHGGSGVSSGVIEQLRAARPTQRFLELVHRLDRGTSGVLLIAKRRPALVALQDLFRERRTEKRYLALVKGRWPLRTRRVDLPLRRYLTEEGERRVAVDPDGRPALSFITGLKHFEVQGVGVCTLVECRIETGRTHQIRVHLAHGGYPILGDDKYGDFESNKVLQKSGHKRMFLHAFSLAYREMPSGRMLRFSAPMPAAFERLSGPVPESGAAFRTGAADEAGVA